MPGCAFPEDFQDLSVEGLAKVLQTGLWAVDWWEGDPTGGDLNQTYYLRPRTKGKGVIYDPSWGGECIFLAEGGCQLQPDQRPLMCRMLIPNEADPGHCDLAEGAFSKQDCAAAWIPYQDTITAAVEAVDPDEIPEPGDFATGLAHYLAFLGGIDED